MGHREENGFTLNLQVNKGVKACKTLKSIVLNSTNSMFLSAMGIDTISIRSWVK